jgi:hypothetical protein
MKFELRFHPKEIHCLAERDLSSLNEEEKEDEREIEEVIGPLVQKSGHYTKDQLLILAYWKSPRIIHHCKKNYEDYVREVTRIALSANLERIRVESLCLLDGVGLPMASVLLHFGFKNLYPILDYRALWSLGIEDPKHNFNLWWAYTECCRELSAKHKVSMRTLDRALWRYSWEKQPKDNQSS